MNIFPTISKNDLIWLLQLDTRQSDFLHFRSYHFKLKMSLLTLLSSSYKSTPALLNDKRWTQEQTRELLEIVGTSEVRTAP